MKQNKPPLRKYLVNELKKEGYLSLDKITAITISLGHKQDTARRILNKDMSKEVEVVKKPNSKIIIGYKIKDENITGLRISPVRETQRNESVEEHQFASATLF